MSAENFLKITYHGGHQNNLKINAYLIISPTYVALVKQITDCIFGLHKQPVSEYRIYWIDEDNDEIDIIDQCQYEVFLKKATDRHHIKIVPVAGAGNCYDSDSNEAAAQAANTAHPMVSCDGCSKKPVVGFRYKCIQCPNYDLCETCERQHKHADHMMVRMPNNTCPSVIETWISGNGADRRHKRKTSTAACPFAFTNSVCSSTYRAADDANGKYSSPGGKESHTRHSRKHHRRQIQNGVFTHLYNMMHDLAEGGVSVLDEETETITKNERQLSPSSSADSEKHKTSNENNVELLGKFISAMEGDGYLLERPATSKKPQSEDVSGPQAENFNAETLLPSNTLEISKPNVDTTPTTTSLTAPSTPNMSNIGQPDSEKLNQATNGGTSSPKIAPHMPENVSNVDPQYMKAGIQILNNFSEMFAKILAPVDSPNGGGISQCPLPQILKQTTSVNENIPVANNSQMVTEEPKAPAGLSANETSNSSIHSDEIDWPVDSLVSVSYGAAENSNAAGGKQETTELNYVQLGRDLHSHMQAEQKKEEQVKLAAPSASNNLSDVIYHWDSRIDKAAKGMMAMGFSNEGNWLINLLESVNGDIPKAVDLLSNAQRSS